VRTSTRAHADQIKQQQRRSQQQLTHHIRRRENGRGDEDGEHGVFEARQQAARRHNARRAQKKNQHRHFKTRAEGENEPGGEREYFAQGPGAHYKIAFEARQKPEGQRKSQLVAEERAAAKSSVEISAKGNPMRFSAG